MEYIKTIPYKELEPFINFYWGLKGSEIGDQWERFFHAGCVAMNL